MMELLRRLVERGWDCTFLTGDVHGTLPDGVKLHNGRKVIKRKPLLRIWTWSLFTLQAIWQIVRHRHLPMLVVTNPPLPMLVMPFIKRMFGTRYSLLIYDIYPDAMERMGMIRTNGFLARLWRRFSAASMRNAESVITLGNVMADVLREHFRPGQPTPPIDIVPTWVDTSVIKPTDRATNSFAIQHGLTDKLVVMYSGSFGATHDLDSIIKAAEILQNHRGIQFMLIGAGTTYDAIAKRVARLALPNLTLLPFQPIEVLPFSLSSADCAIACLDSAYAGISIPSKTYFSMAAGACLVAIAPEDSELASVVERYECGCLIPPRSPAKLAAAIESFYNNRSELERRKANARNAAERYFDRDLQTDHFEKVLDRSFPAS
jgi:glycosyltransferase involved in cell wall biosynthesis